MEKVILHAHSNWSHDSNIKLEEWKVFIEDRNISKVYLTEHEESEWDEAKYEEYVSACKQISSNSHEIIPGLELNINGLHILAPNLKSYMGRPHDNDLKKLKYWIENQGSILIAAHPDKYKIHHEDILSICNGIELINTKPQYNWIFKKPSSQCFRLMKKHNLKPFIGQDIHKLNQFDPLGTMIQMDGNISSLYSPLQSTKPNQLNDILLRFKNISLKIFLKGMKILRHL